MVDFMHLVYISSRNVHAGALRDSRATIFWFCSAYERDLHAAVTSASVHWIPTKEEDNYAGKVVQVVQGVRRHGAALLTTHNLVADIRLVYVLFFLSSMAFFHKNLGNRSACYKCEAFFFIVKKALVFSFIVECREGIWQLGVI